VRLLALACLASCSSTAALPDGAGDRSTRDSATADRLVTAPPGAPLIFHTDLASAPPGAYVTLWGRGFGAVQGSSTVTHAGIGVSKVVSWGDRMIELRLASSAKAGDLVVTTGAGSSPPFPLGVHKGKIYFVSMDGRDNWSGTLEAPSGSDGPVRSLVHGRDLLRPGDVLYVRTSTFLVANDYEAILALRDLPSGTAAAPIAIAGYPGEVATLGDNSLRRSFSLYRGDGGPPLSYLTIAKLHLKPSCSAVELGNGDFGRLVGNEISGAADACQSGVITISGSQGWKILGNTIRGNGNSKLEHGIYLGGYGTDRDCEIAFNRIEAQRGGRAIQLYGHQAGDRIERISIHDNELLEIDRDGIVLGATDADVLLLSDVTIYNNIFHRAGRCVGAGVRITNPTAKGVSILHNTFVDNGAGSASCDQSAGEVGGQIQIDDGAGVDIRNNIFVSEGSEGLVELVKTPASFTGSNNLFLGAAAPSWDRAAVTADPLLKDVAAHDFHLQPGSPASRAGAAAGVVADHDGVARPATGPAIGAYEPTL
jgi:hypothetical protein